MYRKLKRAESGFALVMAIVGLAAFLGVVFGWLMTNQNYKQFTVNERDKKLMTQAVLATSDMVKTRLVKYLQTQTDTFNPTHPISITALSPATINYSAKPTETITIQCIGQGSFLSGQTGTALAPCTNSNVVYPKVFAISISVRTDDGGVVGTLYQNINVGPMAFNDFTYLVTGETSGSISFAGGVYQGMVGAYFETASPSNRLNFINPTGTPLVFNRTVVSNASKDQIYRGINLGWAGTSAVGDIQLNQGFLTTAQPTIDIDISKFRSNPRYSVIEPPASANGVIADKVTVELGGLTAANKCNFRITEERPPSCTLLSQDLISQYCTNFVSPTASKIVYNSNYPKPLVDINAQPSKQELTTSDTVLKIDAQAKVDYDTCADTLMKNLNQKVQFNGKYFETWLKDQWVQVDPPALAKYCPAVSLDAVQDNPPMTADQCLELIRANTGVEAGFDKDGQMVACNSEGGENVTYPAAMPTPLQDNAIYVVKGRQVEFKPIDDSTDAMTVCANATFFVENSSSVTMKTSLLRTRADGPLDWRSPDFAPVEAKGNVAIVAKQGDIGLASATRSLIDSKDLRTLKLANTPASQKSLILEASFFTPTGSPMNVPYELRDPSLGGTTGTLDLNGTLMGKNQVLTRSVTYYGGQATVSGFAYVNLSFNNSNLISPPPIMGEPMDKLPLQATTTSFQLDFANVNEAMAYVSSQQTQSPQSPPVTPTNPEVKVTNPTTKTDPLTETKSDPLLKEAAPTTIE